MRMITTVAALLALVASTGLRAAESAGENADALLDSALKALGGQQESIVISAHGYDACLGQPWSVKEGWARWELTDYKRTFDYRNGATRHTAQRRAGLDPRHLGGCGAQPDAAPALQQSLTDANSPWAEQLLLWLTPQGFLQQLAASHKVTVTRSNNSIFALITVEHDGVGYVLEGRFNIHHELDRVRTKIDDTVFGDMPVEAEFGPYRQFAGVRFPTSYTLKQGGSPVLSLTIDSAGTSTEQVINPAPRRAAPAAAAAAPAFTAIGKGVYALHGAYQAAAVEFDGFVVVIDGLQSDARVEEVIAGVKQAIPGKPIRYVVSTHAHFDHAAGLRRFAAEGAIVITHKMNVDFFRQALATPRTLRRNATGPDQVTARVLGVDGRYTIADKSGQTLDLYALAPNPHAADMLIAWIPATQTVVEADLLQPWISPQFGGKNGPHPLLVYLDAELTRLKLDYRNFLPVHAPPSPPLMQKADLQQALGK